MIRGSGTSEFCHVVLVAAAAMSALLLVSCVVGPSYRSPAPPATNTYTASPMPPTTESAPGIAGAAQHLVSGKDIPAAWWTLFHSPSLDQVVKLALANNKTLTAAHATLRQSQETLTALVGSVAYPKLDASASVTREKISGAQIGLPNLQISPFSLFNASVSVSYAFDIFGGAQRELEAMESEVDFQRFQLEGAYLTITANIVTAAIREASLRAQIEAVREIEAVQEKQLDLVGLQYRLGGTARSDVLAQRTLLAQTRTTLPPLEKELAQTRHLLAVLTGVMPSDAAGLPEFRLADLRLPEELPVSLPSSLVRQRPDISAAEALLRAASAQVGVATANQYPQITLTGSYGSLATTGGTLFSSGSAVWSFGAGLLQPVFHGGELSAKRRAAVAAYDQTMAQYQVVVLQSFQNVADVLRSLEADAVALKAQSEAEASARDTFDLSQQQYQLGGASYLTLLNAEREYQQTRLSLVQAQAARFADTAALFQALGGGWWNRETNHAAEDRTR